MKTKRQHQRAADSRQVMEEVRHYKSIREDYTFDASIFSTEPERTARLKWIIQHRLTQVEQTIILLYADCQSLRKLGARLGLSHTLVAKEVQRIRKKIIEEYNRHEHLP